MQDQAATVLVTNALPRRGLAELEARTRVLYPPEGQTAFTQEQMLALLPGVQAVLAAGPITRRMIDSAPELKIISNYGAGYDRIDVQAASERGVPVTNIPDATAGATAELAMALILAVRRRVSELDRELRSGQPERLFGMGRYMARSLQGATLGIVGMGHIGQALCRMAQAMGMRVLYFNRHTLPPELSQGAAYRTLDELLAESDVVSLHCPLTEQTRGLIGAGQLALMKPGASLINTSRGAVVDTEALIEALVSGKLHSAGLDVFPDEPHVPQQLLALDNVVLTPHVGTNTVEDRDRMAEACAQRILEALSGRRPPNVVNPEIYQR